ncbi:hypothetical protein AB4Z01_32630 [Inquilinus sp. YAF38]|uniref:hypothetical protein n=1 Tax=Inquilinus sp. YAF38 TaxID=3233084 RepID=UPI003F8D9D05
MAFVTEIVLFRARPGIAPETAVETVVEAAEGSRPAIGGTVGADAGRCMQVIDGPGVRLYHCGSRSL